MWDKRKQEETAAALGPDFGGSAPLSGPCTPADLGELWIKSDFRSQMYFRLALTRRLITAITRCTAKTASARLRDQAFQVEPPKSGLKAHAIGLPGATMQAVATIAPAIAALFFTQYVVPLTGVDAPFAYILSVCIVLMLGSTLLL
jgi:hypothetical protein